MMELFPLTPHRRCPVFVTYCRNRMFDLTLPIKDWKRLFAVSITEPRQAFALINDPLLIVVVASERPSSMGALARDTYVIDRDRDKSGAAGP
jgi:hypothetical protein